MVSYKIIEIKDDTVNLLADDGSYRPFSDIENEIYLSAIKHHGNNVTLTAKALKVGRSTLYRKLEQMGYTFPDEKLDLPD